MWYLTSAADPRVIYIVPQCNKITVGRSIDVEVCNFAIPNDSSISRKHVNLSVENGNLFLEDLNSRYGTYVNSEKAEPNTLIRLNNNDTVKFGKLNSVWKVHEVNMVTCTSTLKGENLQSFKLILTNMGGVLKNDWDQSCEYLTMPAITLTIKVVLALVQCSYIVTTDFWVESLKAINSQVNLPDAKNFLPQIIESTLNKEIVSFLPDPRRKTLFEGKRFVFFSRRQFEMYRTVLQNGAATPLLLSECKLTKSSLCEDNVIVIQYNITSTSQEMQTQRNQICDIVNYLKSKNKRIVADAEIGLAVLYCSLEKYCNPDFNFSAEVVKQASGQNNNAPTVLVQETEETYEVKKENIVIDESLVSHDNSNTTTNKDVTYKRKLMDDIDPTISNKSKKLATENINQNHTSVNNVKRKLDDVECTTNPPKRLATDNDIDFFNFNNLNSECKNKQVEKKLNLSKPLKRKADVNTNEEDLFNFVETLDNKCTGESSDGNMLEISNNIKGDETTETNYIEKKQNITTIKDISAMRGIKLEELKKMRFNYSMVNLKQNVKQEATELDEKMRDLDIGFTVVTIKKELIVKKEPVLVEALDSQVKNFKKFKKVWPIKMQVTIVPHSSMGMVTTDGSAQHSIRDENVI